MEDYLQDIIKDTSYSINIKAPVLSRRDNINIKDTISLLERQLKEKEMKPEIEVLLPKPKIFSVCVFIFIQPRMALSVHS